MMTFIANSIGRLMMLLGFPPVAAAIVAILLAEGRPLTLSELAEKTGYAKSHLSSALRILEERFLVELKRGKRRSLLISLKPGAIEKVIMDHIREIRENLRAVLDYTPSELSHGIDSLIKELDSLIEKKEVRSSENHVV
ncbi:helix-turn-helix domain-containing protein [Desulfurococcaceae archaeon MEX13E-LK6-19]|nr:helix-turn-helix domain-containing protein [Desulfurococcaceae archaeon MEX13E-LK6-19]